MSKMTMIYWKDEKFWLGKIKEHPDIMTQGRTIKELEENLRDAFQMMAMDDVPEKHREKSIAV
ncbi:MAG: type II toxin-antitoxin system HicB family antitoxin [Candidatus Dadabacteria bacterium]|nr:type II toxin-antitoxin system HicB family antitoxin [Candidatus Dadabacteria bacterium]